MKGKLLPTGHPDYYMNLHYKDKLPLNIFCDKCDKVKYHNCYTLYREAYSCMCEGKNAKALMINDYPLLIKLHKSISLWKRIIGRFKRSKFRSIYKIRDIK